jgi:hypothetical protein
MTSFGVAKYNINGHQTLSADQSGAANGAVTTRDSHVASVNAENPFVWLFGLGALTLGLVAFSTHVRVGNIRAGVDAGTP